MEGGRLDAQSVSPVQDAWSSIAQLMGKDKLSVAYHYLIELLSKRAAVVGHYSQTKC